MKTNIRQRIAKLCVVTAALTAALLIDPTPALASKAGEWDQSTRTCVAGDNYGCNMCSPPTCS